MESMKYTLLAAAGALMLASTGQAQERIVNGDMGSFGGPPQNQAGVADGWLASDATTPRFAVASSATNSPFTNRYANNDLAWLLSADDATNGAEGYHQQGFTPHAVGIVNFDFNVASLTTNTWGVQINNTGASAAVSLVQFRIDDSFNIAPYQSGNVAGPDIIALSANTWYNVNATINPAAGTYSGSITAFGGSSTPFSGSISGVVADGLYVSGVLIRDRSAGANGDILVDNVSVTPEPASLSLLGLAGAALLRRRK